MSESVTTGKCILKNLYMGRQYFQNGKYCFGRESLNIPALPAYYSVNLKRKTFQCRQDIEQTFTRDYQAFYGTVFFPQTIME